MSGGAFPNASVDFGTGGKVLINSPYALNGVITYICFFGIVITAAIAGQATYQDIDSRSTDFFYTAPISKLDYLGGRFLAAFAAQVVIFASVGLGAWIGILTPWLDKTRLGPQMVAAYFQPYFINVLPNLLFLTAIFFALATLSRKMLPVYVASVLVLVAYFTFAQNANSLTSTGVRTALFDPLGGAVPALRSVLEEQLLAIDQATERLKRHDELIEAQVPLWRYYPAVRAVMCLRGFQLIAATVIVAELGDVRRFAHPRQLTGFLGLVPKEETSGDTRRLGSITKAGNAQARWCLVEAVQKALLPPKVSARLSLRQEGQPALYRELGWKIQVRLHKRGWHLLHRGVMKAKVNVALARELAGFLWDLLRQVPAPQP